MNEVSPLDNDRDGGEATLHVEKLKKYYPVQSNLLNRRVGNVRAVDGVSFQVRENETLAIVGESGCGKSTLAETIIGLHEPTAGSISYNGKDVASLRNEDVGRFSREIQMIFQDPAESLNGRMNVEQIVREPLVVHGWDGDIDQRIRTILSDVGLDPADHLHRFPHELSGGQCQRVAIARALALNPSVLVADEPVSALDVSIQAQILSLLENLQTEYDLTYLLISHDMSVVRQIADRVAVMYLGRIVELADTEIIFSDPQHPYTEALLSSVPTIEGTNQERIKLEGTPPDPTSPPTGCNFHPRCPLAQDLSETEYQQCSTEDPEICSKGKSRQIACHFRPEQKQ